jgi:hypothetical protein
LTTLYTAPAGVSIDFCISSIMLTASNATGGVDAYYYWRLPANRWFSSNGSTLIDQSIQSNGKLQRASQVTIYTSNNVVYLRFVRSMYSDDVSTAHYYNISYNTLVCKVKET